ncbi:branched-chain amino acid ABC transporter permease [soil metagenome]
MRLSPSKPVFALIFLVLAASPALAESNLRSTGYVLQQTLNAAQVGALYSLLAVAYGLLHSITNRIVLSFGDIATFGAFYTIYTVLLMLISGYAPGIAIAVVFLAAIAGTAALGYVVQIGVFTPLIRTPSQAIMIASIGLSIALQEVLRVQSSGRDQWLSPIFADPLFRYDFDGFIIHISLMQIILIGVSAGLIASLLLVLKGTSAGRLWRACSQNPDLARLCGVDTGRVIRWTAAAAAGFAAAGGWILAVAYGGVGFQMGLVYGLKALFASIIGGFGTISGAIAGGLALAALETAWSAFFPIVYRDVAVFLVVILVFVVKPDGLVGAVMRRESEN